MSRKDLKSVNANLAELARSLPTQSTRDAAAAKPKAPAHHEPVVQFSFGLRKSLRKELARLADDADMTMRAFILNALKEKGLNVTDDDLLDLRKERRGGE
ncbi:hypothetical protein [Microbaculum sp. FT89]|uniref:hypothetical protein n=1 Tax=Microbaculum sp. FT89 TaxID=3447298 RepID=UPI003F535CA4